LPLITGANRRWRLKLRLKTWLHSSEKKEGTCWGKGRRTWRRGARQGRT
jgi:hypothetical protein